MRTKQGILPILFYNINVLMQNAAVLELVDKHGLGPCTERRGGSSPLCGTKTIF